MARIALVRCEDYELANITAALRETFELLGGMAKYVRPGVKVVLKANLLMPKRPQDAATTHPALVRGVADLVRRAGGEVTIIDSPGGPYIESLLKQVYSACGMEQAAREAGAKLNFDLSTAEVNNPDGKYLKKLAVLKPLAEADVIINLPKLKTHGQMAFTGAIKNMFGAIPGLQKAEYHMRMPDYEDFADALIDIYLAAKPTLNIMDAVVGMDGSGPSAGNPKPIGLIIAGEDGFALDFTALSIVGVDPADIPLIKQAQLRGLCPKGLEEIEIAGEAVERVRIKDFNMPRLKTLKAVGYINKGPLKPIADLLRPRPVFDQTKCSGCADCAKNCPARIIKMKNKRPEPDLSQCIRCFCCQELCPAGAVTIRRSKAGDFLVYKAVPLFFALMNKFRKPAK